MAAFSGEKSRNMTRERTSTGTPIMISLNVVSSSRGARVKFTSSENGSPVRDPVETPASVWKVSTKIVTRLVAPRSTMVAASGFVKSAP